MLVVGEVMTSPFDETRAGERAVLEAVGAELVLAARKEMAPTLADAVIRRTPLGALGHPGEAALARAAAIVGSELGWTDERTRQEISAVDAFYGKVNVQM